MKNGKQFFDFVLMTFFLNIFFNFQEVFLKQAKRNSDMCC
jgi:hypothetical protein